MKKEYIEPRMEAIEIRTGCQILAGSVTNASSGDVFDTSVTGGSEPGRAPLFDDPAWDALLGE